MAPASPPAAHALSLLLQQAGSRRPLAGPEASARHHSVQFLLWSPRELDPGQDHHYAPPFPSSPGSRPPLGFSHELRHRPPVSGPAPLGSHRRQTPNCSVKRPTAVPLPHFSLAIPPAQNVGLIGGQGHAWGPSALQLPAPLCSPPGAPLQRRPCFRLLPPPLCAGPLASLPSPHPSRHRHL